MVSARLVPVSDAEYTRLASGTPLPVEQAPVWDRFDAVVPGREPWGRLAFYDGAELAALVSLTRVRLPGGLQHLWAKNGPVWVLEATAQRERELRARLAAALRRVDPRVVYVRLHACHDADDVQPVMQGITYDRTVVVDLERGEEDIFAGMKQQGRRAIRKALKDDSMVVREETGLPAEAFGELYDVLLETGGRGGYGLHPAERYHQMLSTLGPEHARMFVVRRDGRPLAWALVTLNDGHAVYSVGASSDEARGSYAMDLLHWRIIQTLRAEGARAYDLAGAGSERYPGLNTLTQFKTKFDKTVIDAPPLRDLPVRPWAYRVLLAAQRTRRAARAGLSEITERAARREPEA